jgi:hypothetical protein
MPSNLYDPRERVAAACPKSKYKDDRHEWNIVMHEDAGMLLRGYPPNAKYALRRCSQCKLCALLLEIDGGPFSGAPMRDDLLVHAFFEGGA